MKNIYIGEDTNAALKEIREARGPVCVELGIGSCCRGNAIDVLLLGKALKRHEHETIAKVYGIATAIALAGADKVEMDREAMIVITPLKVCVSGSHEEQVRAIKNLRKLTRAVSEALSRWPEVQAIFDSGEERFLTKIEAAEMGILGGQA